MNREEELKHFGVKGMRWGKRKGRQSTESKAVTRLAGQKAKSLSNKQLATINKRMQLEKTFKKHTTKDYSVVKKILSNVLKKVGPIIFTAYATKKASDAGYPPAQAAVKLLTNP